MAEQKLRLRAEIPEKDTWDLTDLYPSDAAWEAHRDELKRTPQQLAAYRGKLGDSAQNLLALLQLEDALSLEYQRLYNYADRKLDEDTTRGIYQGYSAQVKSLFAEVSTALAYRNPEILAIPEEKLESFYQQEPQLEHYRLALQRIRVLKPHTLSEPEEKILAMASEVTNGPGTIYGTLADADLTFPNAVDSQGESHLVSHGAYFTLLHSSDRALRRSAYEAVYGAYGAYQNTFAATFASHVKGLQLNAKARHYENALEASLKVNEVPTEVYLNLIEAVHQNLDKLHRYVSLRKKVLGLEEMHMYDMYAPIIKDVDWKVSFEEGKELVIAAMAPLGEEYCALLRKGMEERWVDIYENVGKRSGAYSSGSRPHPYVLLNYQGTLEDVFTLAHEMGHCLHSYLSNRTQSPTYSDYVIFVAEVASTCNEALLMQYLLKITTDPQKRAYLLNYFLEQFRSTLYRQTQLAEFELRANQLADSGESLIADNLSALYGELNHLYFGDDVVTDANISLEWARIPHFYYNYYLYQYATSFAASMAVSARILREGQPAVDDYLAFLSKGCSEDPISLLRGAGVDMATAQPINQALEQFGGLLDEMEAVLGL
jgi:oligoendopeptidase F